MSDQQLQKVKVNKLAHVGLWVSDIVAQTRFYRQTIGLDQRTPSETLHDTESNDAATFLALGDEHHCLALFNDVRPIMTNGRKPANRSPLHHLSFEVSNDAELAALAARLKISGVDPRLETRDGDPELGDTLWFSDPDGNRIEISVTPEDTTVYSSLTRTHRPLLRPYALQHIGLQTTRLEEMVDFYTEALGFDISDWLLRESAWLRCTNDHHTIMFTQGRQGIDHIAFTATDGAELLRWSDYLSRRQTPILWGPGRHGAGSDLFVRFADPEGVHIEFSAELQQYYDRDVTTPPRLWHTRIMAHNLWGTLPTWMHEEVRV
ncbi:MAG: VOC family protein [Ktedonobacteraceae bacterium]